MRLLVIDDSSVDRFALVNMLQNLGHDVDECDSADNALLKIESGSYNLVFLDVVMPGQDGYKFLRSLRLNPSTSEQYVVFCSSKKTPLEVNYGLKRAGANDYITKPVTHEIVLEVLQRVSP